MAMLGQASGGFTESSSSLRLLHVGVRNSTGVLADDAFTQTNPVGTILAGQSAATYATNSPQVATSVLGVLSGSVAFTRPQTAEGGNNEIGGLGFATVSGVATVVGDLRAGQTNCVGVRPIGIFINHAAGYSFENTPALASSKSPYVSAQGTYANSLFETVRPSSVSTNVTYLVGNTLVSSINGFLISLEGSTAASDCYNGASAETIGILKMVSDSAQDEIMYDQRI